MKVTDGNLLNRDGRRIQTCINAADANGTPLQQIFRKLAVHGVEIVEPRITFENDFRQFVVGLAEVNAAIHSKFAAENKYVELGIEIRIKRTQFEIIQLQMNVG